MRSLVKVIVFGSSLYRFTAYPDCIIRIPWKNCMRKVFLHLHLSVCSIFDCPALSLAALQLYGMVWYLPMQLQITVAPSILKLRNKLWIQFVGRSQLSQRHAPCLSFTLAKHQHGPMPLPWLSSSEDKDRQTGPAGAVVPEMNRDW